MRSIAAALAAPALALVLAGVAGCGKYGPPVRAPREPVAPQPNLLDEPAPPAPAPPEEPPAPEPKPETPLDTQEGPAPAQPERNPLQQESAP